MADSKLIDRIQSARAAKLKYQELEALIHDMPKDHPSRGMMRHTLSKLWMFSKEAMGDDVETGINQ